MGFCWTIWQHVLGPFVSAGDGQCTITASGPILFEATSKIRGTKGDFKLLLSQKPGELSPQTVDGRRQPALFRIPVGSIKEVTYHILCSASLVLGALLFHPSLDLSSCEIVTQDVALDLWPWPRRRWIRVLRAILSHQLPSVQTAQLKSSSKTQLQSSSSHAPDRWHVTAVVKKPLASLARRVYVPFQLSSDGLFTGFIDA